MSNPILEELQKMGENDAEYRKTNDARLKAIEEREKGRAQELDTKLVKLEQEFKESREKVKLLELENEKKQARIEVLEAIAERPRGTPEEKKALEYRTTFESALRNGFQDVHKNTSLKEMMQKDVSIGTNASGGFALPKEIGMEVEKLVLKFSEIVSNVKLIQVGTSDYQELVSYNGGGFSGWVSETGSRSATTTPNLRSQKPTWGELYAYPQVTEWSLQDLQFNVASWLSENIAEQFAVDLATAIFSGNGSAKPTGMTNTAPVATDDYASPMRSAVAYEYHFTAASSYSPITAWKGDALIDLMYLVRPLYRPNAKWAMNTNTQAYVRKLKDTTGQYIWQPGLQAGQPDMLLGKPVFTWEDLGNPTTGSALPVAFGDFRKGYLMVYRTEIMMNTDNGITTPGYVKFYTRRRYGGFPLNNDAVKFLKVSAS